MPKTRKAELPVLLLGLMLITAAVSSSAETLRVADFSQLQAGAPVPAPWRLAKLRSVAPTEFSIAAVAGQTALRMTANNAAAALYRPLRADPTATPMLHWRWRVDEPVAGADIRRKTGDDLPARLYLMFDYPLARLPLIEQGKIRLARAVAGEMVPAASLCYVWDATLPAGTTFWNPYSNRVRVIVLRSGPRQVGRWVSEERDIAADFRAAFGEAPPPVSGIALGADTDQTGGSARAWFGDIQLMPR